LGVGYIMPDRQTSPKELAPFIELGVDYDDSRRVGDQAFMDCLFCGGHNKLYINYNKDTGRSQLWDCKVCGKHGNLYTFMELWYEKQAEATNSRLPAYKKAWQGLATDRSIPVQILKNAGIVFDGDLFYIPVRNQEGKLVNLRYYRVPRNGTKFRLRGLTGVEAGIYGLHNLKPVKKGQKKPKIWNVEGEWDAIALEWMMERDGVSSASNVVLGIPGANIFKAKWVEYFQDHHVICCYDAGVVGEQGTERVNSMVHKVVTSLHYLAWPIDSEDGHDIRDFVVDDGTMSELSEMIKLYITPNDKANQNAEAADIIHINSKLRPKFSDILEQFASCIHLTPDLIDGIKLCYATILSTLIPGPPAWCHIVGPPGSGKTLVILSTGRSGVTHHISKLSPKLLISGFIAANGEDPSLIPRVDGKTIMIKDFTPSLTMPVMVKDELFGQLRDAFDGTVGQEYANNAKRYYESHFSIVTGVTPAIYGERSAALGERFLMLHVIKGNDFEAHKPINSAIRGVGRAKKEVISDELLDMVARFLDVSVDPNEIADTVPEHFFERINSLAQIVAVLRASVDRDKFNRDGNHRAIRWRPQKEMGTRLGIQFMKVIMGLGMLNSPPSIGEEEYRVLVRVALDSCVGFNMEAVAALIAKPNQTILQLAEECDIHKNTLLDQLDDLMELGAVQRRQGQSTVQGVKPYIYFVTSKLVALWKEALLVREGNQVKHIMSSRKRLKIRVIKRRSMLSHSR